MIGLHLEALIHDQKSPELISALLLKLLRNGYVEETLSDSDEPTNIWPALVRQAIAQNRSNLMAGWSPMFKLLPQSAQNNIVISLVSFLDRYSMKKGRNSHLLNGDEILRAGQEGSRFLSTETWDEVLKTCSIVGLMFAVSDKSIKNDLHEDNSDTEEESNDSVLVLGQALVPSAKGYWSPLTARLLVHILSSQQGIDCTKACSRFLGQAIDLWSSPSRIKTAMWEQEVYLTTVIVILAAQLPASSVLGLCTSATFIAGVSSHLEHLSPNVRRMGMLIAELVSTANTSTKPLTFTRAIWEGKGEGKEEARVLRALFYGWSSREMTAGSLDEKSILSAFHLAESQNAMVVKGGPIVRQVKRDPATRILPARRPAPSRKRQLIQSIGGASALEDDGSSQGEQLPTLTNIQGIKPVEKAVYVSAGEESSSSEDDSSASELEERHAPAGPEKKEEFGLGMPEKKKRRAPIYIHELVSLLQENEREANKLALKHSENLIRKKAGWGGEVNENAINICLALLALQNNYGFKQFEERKKAALTALVVASPGLVGPCLCEQYFNQQYSITQRVCILNSLAFGARKLSLVGDSDSSTAHSSSQTRALADDLSNIAITRARAEGEARVPEIQREASLLIQPRPSKGTLDARSAFTTDRAAIGKPNAYLDLAATCFIFPLLNRFWSQLDHISVTRRNRYKGSGSTALLSPFMMSAFLDTVAILCYCAQNAAPFQNDIVPEVMSLCLTITTSSLARIESNVQDDGDGGGGPSAILGASSNLLLLLLDAVWQLDYGRNLLQRYSEQVNEVQRWAEALFESVQNESALHRSGRCSAAILLRISEMKQRIREQVTS
jgi:telomere length regulation protein